MYIRYLLFSYDIIEKLCFFTYIYSQLQNEYKKIQQKPLMLFRK